MSREVARPGSGCNCRTAMILGCKQLLVLAGCVLMFGLGRQCLSVRLVGISFFLRSWPCFNAAWAVKGDMRVIHNDGLVVDVGDGVHVHVHDRAVVEESAASPLAAGKANATVSETVVNSAIEADVRSPIASVPAIEAAGKAPVTWRPEQAYRRNHPCAGNPEVSIHVIP